MKKYVLLFVLGISLLFSCSEKDKYHNAHLFGFKDFKSEIKLEGKILQFNDSVMHPSEIQVYDSILITLETDGEKLCNVYNLNTKEKIGERLTRGQGPNEMIMPFFIKNNGLSVQIVDIATSTIYEYDFKDFINNPDPKPTLKSKLKDDITSGMQMVGEKVIGYSYFKKHQLYSFDKQGAKINEFADFPPSSIPYSDIEKADAYYMGFTSNGTDKIAICYYMTDLIEIYNSTGTLEKRMHGPEHFFVYLEQVGSGDNLTSKAVKGKNRDAFFSPENAGDHFLVLYNGGYVDEKNHSSNCDKLFSFSWDGTPLNRYLLNDPIYTFCVDKKLNKIYGVSKAPDYHIVEYTY